MFTKSYYKTLENANRESWKRFPDKSDFHAECRFKYIVRELELLKRKRAHTEKIIFYMAQLIALILILISIFCFK
jgi:hypothetical protein